VRKRKNVVIFDIHCKGLPIVSHARVTLVVQLDVMTSDERTQLLKAQAAEDIFASSYVSG